MTLAVNNSKGWHDNQSITEIKEKTGQDATGYQLTNKVSIDEKMSTVTINFGPPEDMNNVPIEDRTAFIIGGEVLYPLAN
jgi:hypothetical protein